MISSALRRTASAVALALSLVALLALLAGPAQARRAACSSSANSHSSAHVRRAARACAQARHAAKVRAKRRAAQRSRAKHKLLRPAGGRRSGSGTGVRAAPSCEGGEAPARERGGLSCADGSEPACPAGMSLASEGTSIFCAPGAETEAEFDSEGVCEAASSGACGPVSNAEPPRATCPGGAAPLPSGGEAFACPDGSVPQCAEGFTPTPSSDGTSVACVAVLTAEPTS